MILLVTVMAVMWSLMTVMWSEMTLILSGQQLLRLHSVSQVILVCVTYVYVCGTSRVGDAGLCALCIPNLKLIGLPICEV